MLLALASVAACGGQADVNAGPSLQPDAGTGDDLVRDAAYTDAAADADASVPNVDGASDGDAETDPEACACPPGPYHVELTMDGTTRLLAHTHPVPENLAMHCTPLVPWMRGTLAGKTIVWRAMGACQSGDFEASCLFLRDDGPAVYLDEQGSPWDISDVSFGQSPFANVGERATGSYNAIATSPKGTTLPISGSFDVCHAYAVVVP